MSSLGVYAGLIDGTQLRAWATVAPGPGVSIPHMGQDVYRGRIRPTIDHRNAAQDVLLVSFGILDEDVEVTIFLEGIAQGVNQLILG